MVNTNKYMRVAVTVCIDYADFLKVTLPHNRPLFDVFIIVTEAADTDTRALAEEHACNIILLDIRHQNGAKFNKSGMIHIAQKYIHETYPDSWICILDADIVIPPMFLDEQLDTRLKTTLYGLDRYMYETKDMWIHGGESYSTTLDTSLIHGYFQLYYDKTKYYAQWSDNCAWCDTDFNNLFSERELLTTSYSVAHLGLPAYNWNGRVTKIW